MKLDGRKATPTDTQSTEEGKEEEDDSQTDLHFTASQQPQNTFTTNTTQIIACIYLICKNPNPAT